MPISNGIRCFLVVCFLASPLASESVMLSGGYESENADPNFEIALSAVQREDWRGAIAALENLIERRAFDDDAHTLLGYAYRKRGDYEASLRSYRRALELNPHHRGALEYLGEAYLELGDRLRALETLERLAEVCQLQNSSDTAAEWQESCLEWTALHRAIRVDR